MNKNDGPPKRQRLRDLGITIGHFPTGKNNAITDVKGVKVGHTTLIQGQGKKTSKQSGPVRTGVTAIIPCDEIFGKYLIGGSFILNGAGELLGITQVHEWGVIESPILLTNTFSVGVCSQAVIDHMTDKYPGIGADLDVIMPIVGECDDSWLNNITGNHLKPDHVIKAITEATDGPVPEGNVGGGTGMITCDFKGGIGTSSRKIALGEGTYTVGILVMSNFGERENLRIDGLPIGKMLAGKYKDVLARQNNYGSIITVIATDCPLSAQQLNRLCKRAALGIGRVGSHAAHGSGEIIIGFSTANKIKRDCKEKYNHFKTIPDKTINPLYEAVIEATEEAIVNSLCMGDDMVGINNHFIPKLPLDDVKTIFAEYKEFEKRVFSHKNFLDSYKIPDKIKAGATQEVGPTQRGAN